MSLVFNNGNVDKFTSVRMCSLLGLQGTTRWWRHDSPRPQCAIVHPAMLPIPTAFTEEEYDLDLYCWSKWTLNNRYRRRSFKFMPPDISSAQHRVNWSRVFNWIICIQSSQVPRPTPWNLCTVHLDIICTFGSRCTMDWCPCGCQLSCLHTLWSLVWWRCRCQPLPAQVLSMPARLPADSWWSSTLPHSCECSWPFLCL